MSGPHRVYYGNSGAEAVECALKLARYHTKRQNVIAFFGAFHGRTMGALSLTASKPQQRRRFGPPSPGVTHVLYPDVYRKGEQDALACARFIEDKLFKTTLPPDEVAAVFVEPMQGEVGQENGGRSSTPACNLTLSAWRKASLPGCRWESLSAKPTSWTGCRVLTR